ncbi:DNA cytosine methyltransferase [Exiguobacterium sp. s70]|uniref:DNA cytosine methyltransferase n=1 Tax=Exiguobacterium sp. s70 TaxID=2751228 RepID=UPI001BE9CFBF|nr:DNA cytosine methyltransferase [Exiguobacterium sp. s70]
MNKPKIVSIFSGGGGIDLGFKQAGYEVLFATDYWQPAVDTLLLNNSAKLAKCSDIRNINYSDELFSIGHKINDVDLLVGGPPCPAYSKSRFYRTEKKRALEDENSFTLFEYFRALEELKPKVFFFENVAGFVFKPHRAAFDALLDVADQFNYHVTYKVINSANYGVAQTRERFICVGVRKDVGKPFIFPDETHCNPDKLINADLFEELKPWVTCEEIIGDLDYDLPEDVDMEAGSKHKHLLKEIPPGDNYLYFTEKRGHPNPQFEWRSRYWSFLLKLSPKKPSWTIQASFSNNQGPFHWKNRFLRISEIKRIQSFPDDYEITGSFKDQWRQIGNAVPPLLVEQIASSIKKQFFVQHKEKIS